MPRILDLAVLATRGQGAQTVDDPVVFGDTITGSFTFFDFSGGGATRTVDGSGANEYFISGRRGDTIDMFGGDDIVLAGDGNDTVDGGAGNDTIYGEAGNDLIDGGADDDFVSGGAGSDVLTGGLGMDTLIGGDGADTFNADDGAADLLLAREGIGTFADTFNGDEFDTVSYAGESFVTVDLENNTADDFATGDTYFGIINLTGSGFGDSLTGTDADGNVLNGGAGGDRLFGLGGDDVLNGGASADLLDGGAGADTLDGGTADDTVTYENSSLGVTVDLQAGTGLGGDAEGDVLSNIENVIGSEFDDVITGVDGLVFPVFAELVGLGGNDTITGGDGADGLFGGELTFQVGGAVSGDDVLDGGGGNDNLTGGDGTDILTGGAGSDFFDFIKGDESDTITDYDPIGDGMGEDDAGINISGFAIGNFEELEPLLASDGMGNTVLNFGNGNVLTILGLDPLDLSSADFFFV